LTENSSYSRHLHAANGSGQSPPTATFALRTAVHDPVASDFTIALQAGNQVLVTVKPPANSGVGGTGVIIRRSLDLINWTTVPTSAGVYTVTDTGLVGSLVYAYQIQYSNADYRVTALSPIQTLTTAAAPPPMPTGLSGAAQSPTSIQWVWQDVPGETGFVLHDDAHNVKGTIGSGLTSFLETSLPENAIASRHVHARTPPDRARPPRPSPAGPRCTIPRPRTSR
jgi:hypothetical protein